MKINKNKVNMSIWLMLPVSCVITMVLGVFTGSIYFALFYAPIMVLINGAVIWIPSMIFTVITERLWLRESSTAQTVLAIFGLETAVTFSVILMLFGQWSFEIPLLSLVMSIIIQFARWIYLKQKNRLYEISTLQIKSQN